MGLDQHVFKVTMLTDWEVSKLSQMSADEIAEYFDSNVSVVLCDSIDSRPELLQLLPFLTKVIVPKQFVNIEKFKTDNDIPLNWKTAGQGWKYDSKTHTSYVKYNFYDESTGCWKDVLISEDDFNEKYVYDEPSECYAWKEDDVDYWGKVYDLRDQISALIPGGAINCGYYALTEEMINVLKSHNGFESGVPAVDHETTELFYHPWW